MGIKSHIVYLLDETKLYIRNFMEDLNYLVLLGNSAYVVNVFLLVVTNSIKII
jgi:hypothetical protein